MRHLLLAAVPPERLFRLRTLDPERFQWEPVETWPEAVDVIRAKPVDMAVVDPLLGGGAPRSHGIERLRQFFPSLPLLVYTDLTPATAGILLELGRAGIRRVVVHRFEDAPGPLRSALVAELEHSASQQVIQALGDILHELPPELRVALEAMLHAPGDGPTVMALAERARLTRRTCERWFTKVGLPSPRMVMVLTRLLYAHRLLLDPGYTVEDVALKLGYSKTKTLQVQLRAVFGLTAGELRVSLTAEEAMAAVTSRYFTSHGAGGLVTERILIIDDEPALRRTLERALNALHYDVVSAGDADLAYTRLEEADVDLVLLDLHLPQISGDALFLALVRRWPRLHGRIILMTGDSFAVEDHWPPELVACPLLLKPFSLDALARAVRSALAAAAAAAASHQRASDGHP